MNALLKTLVALTAIGALTVLNKHLEGQRSRKPKLPRNLADLPPAIRNRLWTPRP